MNHHRNNPRDSNKIVICDVNGDIIENGISNPFHWTNEMTDVPHWIDFTFPISPTISSNTEYRVYNICPFHASSTYYSLVTASGGRMYNDSGYPEAFTNPNGLNESSIELSDRRASMYLTYSNPSFISSWDTTKAGTSPAKTIALPLFNGGTYNFTVDYGDNSGIKTVTSWDDANATYEYADDGIYTVTITGQIEGFRFVYSGDKLRIVGISNWGTLKVGTNQGLYFTGCRNLVVTATDVLNTSSVTNMGGMFSSCSLFNGSLAGWDTSNVTNMAEMFSYCSSFNQPVAHLNTSKVTDMGEMFAGCYSFNQPLAGWDTSNLIEIWGLLDSCRAFNGSVANLNLSKITNMYAVFLGCSSFNQSLATWDVSNITNMQSMLSSANALSQANYDATLIAWSALTVKPNVVFHAGDATYSTGAATTARGVLTGSPNNWTITDGGQN